ncbi:MAG: preprotein translocase subunit SecY [Lachnospiraceae bacterium]|nr:preprotein translocase subunit SecY [Lachnospiraceae bacterium]
MFKMIINAFKVKEIRSRLLFTLIALVVVRLGCNIHTPGIDTTVFQTWIESSQLNLGFLDTFTGGSFTQMTIFALGISPYINAEIIMQLLTIAIPALEEMQKDGEDGRKKIQKISRYLTIVLALIESTAMAISFGRQTAQTASGVMPILNGGSNFRSIALVAISFTAGTAFLMWLGDKITEKGVGNGISIILLINIVSRLPEDIMQLTTKFVTGASQVIYGIIGAIVIIAIIVGLVALIILLQDAERRIGVQYTRKIVGHKQVGGQSSVIPLKVNTSGVIPVIFAMSVLQVPIIVSSFFGVTAKRGNVWEKILYLFDQKNWFNFTGEGELKYTLGVLIYVALILFFAYFYTAVTFNPVEISNNLKRQGGLIPGTRPGKPTIDYLTGILNKIVFIGAIALAIVAILPIFFMGIANVSVSFAATSIIIVVGVVLETMKQIESMMAVRHYKGFLGN